MKKYVFLIFLVYNLNTPSYSQISIGDPALNFTLPTLSNQPVNLQESAGTVFQFRQQYNLTYPMVLDINGSVFSTYGFTIIPSNVLIGRDVRIVWIEEGFDIPQFVNLIDSLVQLTDLNMNNQSLVKAESFELLGAYPNPSNSVTNIQINILKSGILKMDLFDITGRSLFSDRYRVSQGVAQVPVQLADFASGIYLYTLTMEKQQITGRLIYQR